MNIPKTRRTKGRKNGWPLNGKNRAQRHRLTAAFEAMKPKAFR